MSNPDAVPQLGAWPDGDGVGVRVWAPGRRSVEVVLGDRRVPLSRSGAYFEGRVSPAGVGLRYRLSVDQGPPVPDPWSRSQPEGVHGPSEVIDQAFDWHDGAWRGPGQEGQSFYELHVGTATGAGTFEALIDRLDELVELGITALELMPVASFPGTRNWGYDGVFPLAPQASYGGPLGLKRLVDAAHVRGLAVVLDLVLNHLGPEGNYLGSFGPYESRRHRTPWGAALDYDGPSGPVMRELALRTVELWIRDYHLDGLRLDATHAIHDQSPTHLLEELRERALAAAGGRRILLVAEDGLNRAHLTREAARSGVGLSMQWSDDFHHVVRRLVTGDDRGYYRDFEGTADELAHVVQRGWLYEGQHSVHYGVQRGSDASDQDASRFVVFLQNHDQIGNRPLGDRLTDGIPLATFRALSALLLLGPQTPLLFMGQEWAAGAPFRFFTDFAPGLGRAVREGRRREAEHFEGGPVPRLPDPQAAATLESSRLDWSEAGRPGHREVRALYRELLALRRRHPALSATGPGSFRARALGPRALELVRGIGGDERLTLVVNLGGPLEVSVPSTSTCLLQTGEARFGGTGASPSLDGGRLVLEGPIAVLLQGEPGRRQASGAPDAPPCSASAYDRIPGAPRVPTTAQTDEPSMSLLTLPTLSGPRVRLRSITTGDVEALFELGSDPVVMRYVAKPPWTRREQAVEKVAQFLERRRQGTGLSWALTRPDEDRLFGYVTVFALDAEQRRASIGYALARHTHGQGLASEALPLALAFLFDALSLRRVEAEVDPANVASRRLLRRLGFVEEGLARERWESEGSLIDSVCYGLLAREFPGARGAGHPA